jgi:hypothetical protein
LESGVKRKNRNLAKHAPTSKFLVVVVVLWLWWRIEALVKGLLPTGFDRNHVRTAADDRHTQGPSFTGRKIVDLGVVMILPQVHLRKPCYDFTFL